MSKFTHFDPEGNARMVDTSNKAITAREAVAEGLIHMNAETFNLIVEGKHKKGDVLGVARIAGIMGAKKTADLVPLCHPLPLNAVEIELTPIESKNMIHCQAVVRTTGQTGVEMEALTAVQTTLLTIYDMCKAVDRGMTMTNIRLLAKSGGKSGTWSRS